MMKNFIILILLLASQSLRGQRLTEWVKENYDFKLEASIGLNAIFLGTHQNTMVRERNFEESSSNSYNYTIGLSGRVGLFPIHTDYLTYGYFAELSEGWLIQNTHSRWCRGHFVALGLPAIKAYAEFTKISKRFNTYSLIDNANIYKEVSASSEYYPERLTLGFLLKSKNSLLGLAYLREKFGNNLESTSGLEFTVRNNKFSFSTEAIFDYPIVSLEPLYSNNGNLKARDLFFSASLLFHFNFSKKIFKDNRIASETITYNQDTAIARYISKEKEDEISLNEPAMKKSRKIQRFEKQIEELNQPTNKESKKNRQSNKSSSSIVGISYGDDKVTKKKKRQEATDSSEAQEVNKEEVVANIESNTNQLDLLDKVKQVDSLDEDKSKNIKTIDDEAIVEYITEDEIEKKSLQVEGLYGGSFRLQKGFYLICGAFESKENALNFQDALKSKQLVAIIIKLPSRGKYYLYTDFLVEEAAARNRLESIRQISGLENTWLLNVE